MSRAARLRPLAVRALGLILCTFALSFLIFLPFAGRFFVRQDPLEKADLLLVLAGARIERWLEGVDLYKEGWAPRIVVSPGPTEAIEQDLRARGVYYPREGELMRNAIVALGVPAEAVTILPDGVDNTAQEAAALRRMFPSALHRIIVVTSPYHTRRAGYAFRREFRGSGVRIIVRGSRYSSAEPARWWRHRQDVRFLMSEMPKFAAYVAGLGE